jgi:hypothetical protein
MFPFRSLLLSCVLPWAAFAAPPLHVYLTWQGDTATTLTVTFHTDEPLPAGEVRFDTVSRNGQADAYTRRAVAAPARRIKGLDARHVHVAELTGLPPGGDVFFIAGHPAHGFSPERKARTIPADATEIRFAQGGDFGTSPEVGPLLAAAAAFEPHFAALGGDLAYANDSLSNHHLWERWLTFWCANMVTPRGYTVPMVLAIGNHEVEKGGGLRPKEQARYYYTYFPQGFGDVAYGVKRFGRDLAFLSLDSDHTAAVGGAQTTWLAKTLRDLADVRYKMAMYHVPMYPSHRKYESTGQRQREHWLPLFDSLGLSCAWENHDHTYKRTHLLKGGKIDPAGIPYFGDGCWGRSVRTVDASRWYLKKAAPLQHYWICDVTPAGFVARAADAKGRVFDVYPDTHPEAAAAEAMLASLRTQVRHPDLVAAQRPPRAPAKPGLRAEVRPGSFATLDKLRAAPAGKATVTTQVVPRPAGAPTGPLGVLYRGYLNVATNGLHTFWLTSDGLASLTVADIPLLETVAGGKVVSRQGTLQLAEGRHAVEVAYAAGAEGALLALEWSEPGRARTHLPAARQSHDDPSVRLTRVALRIQDDDDDAEEDLKTGKVNLTSSDLEIVTDRNDQRVALRFPGLNIPADAHVRMAYLQFTAEDPGSGNATFAVRAEASPDAAPFTKADRSLSARTTSPRMVTWRPGPWTAKESGTAQRTANLAPLIEEWITRPDAKPGGALALFIEGYGKRVAAAFKGGRDAAPLLVVEYEE